MLRCSDVGAEAIKTVAFNTAIGGRNLPAKLRIAEISAHSAYYRCLALLGAVELKRQTGGRAVAQQRQCWKNVIQVCRAGTDVQVLAQRAGQDHAGGGRRDMRIAKADRASLLVVANINL